MLGRTTATSSRASTSRIGAMAWSSSTTTHHHHHFRSSRNYMLSSRNSPAFFSSDSSSSIAMNRDIHFKHRQGLSLSRGRTCTKKSHLSTAVHFAYNPNDNDAFPYDANDMNNEFLTNNRQAPSSSSPSTSSSPDTTTSSKQSRYKSRLSATYDELFSHLEEKHEPKKDSRSSAEIREEQKIMETIVAATALSTSSKSSSGARKKNKSKSRPHKITESRSKTVVSRSVVQPTYNNVVPTASAPTKSPIQRNDNINNSRKEGTQTQSKPQFNQGMSGPPPVPMFTNNSPNANQPQPAFPTNDNINNNNDGTKKRRSIPPVLEYDNSHYDPEFGEVRSEETSVMEYHPGLFHDDFFPMDPANEQQQQQQQQQQQRPSIVPPSEGMTEIKMSSINGSSPGKMSTRNLSTVPQIMNDDENEDESFPPLEEADMTSSQTPRASNSSSSRSIPLVTKMLNLPTVPNDIEENSVPETKIVSNSVIANEKEEKSIPDVQTEGENSNNNDVVKSDKDEFLKAASYGNGSMSQTSILQLQLDELQTEIYSLNTDQAPFNINSPKQVSMVLFGVNTESTNKDILEGLAGNSSNGGGKVERTAGLILNYRKVARHLKKLERDMKNKEDGTHVSSLYSGLPAPKVSKGNSSSSSSSTDATRTNNASLDPASAVSSHEKRNPLVLIDTSAYIFRAYYSMPPLHRYDGEPIGAVLGFCNMLNRLVMNQLLKGEEPRVVLVFDSKDGTNFRKELYSEYKSNRKPCPDDLIPQFDFVKEAADAYGIVQVEASGFEADDVIATLATLARDEGSHVNILSGDKDLMQLVTLDTEEDPESSTVKPSIHQIDPMNMKRVSHDVVVDTWGVRPDQLGDVLALAGDTADNIPGIPGIGKKIAANLIQEYGTLEELLTNSDKIKQVKRREKIIEHTEMARLSRKLVELERCIPLDQMNLPSNFDRISDFRMEKIDKERLLRFYSQMGFKELKRRMQDRFALTMTSDENPLPRSNFDTFNTILNEGIASKQKKKSQKMTPKAGGVSSNENEIIGSAESNNNRSSSSDGPGMFSYGRKFDDPPKPAEYDDVPF